MFTFLGQEKVDIPAQVQSIGKIIHFGNDHEFIASETGNEMAEVTTDTLQGFGNHLQHDVGLEAAVVVVDGLELVDIQHEQEQLFVVADSCNLGIQESDQAIAVIEPRQRIRRNKLGLDVEENEQNGKGKANCDGRCLEIENLEEHHDEREHGKRGKGDVLVSGRIELLAEQAGERDAERNEHVKTATAHLYQEQRTSLVFARIVKSKQPPRPEGGYNQAGFHNKGQKQNGLEPPLFPLFHVQDLVRIEEPGKREHETNHEIGRVRKKRQDRMVEIAGKEAEAIQDIQDGNMGHQVSQQGGIDIVTGF